MVLNLNARKELESRIKQFNINGTKKNNKEETKKDNTDNEPIVSEEDISYVN